MGKMNQEQEKFQNSLRKLLLLAKESGQKLTEEQTRTFFEEQNLSEEQRAMVLAYLEAEQIDAEQTERSSETEKEKLPLTAEEEHFLKMYLEELPEAEEITQEKKRELFAAAAEGDTLSRSRLLEYYMPRIPELAREIYDQTLFFGDLVQEGNVSLLLALEKIDLQEPEEKLLREIRSGMRELLEEHHDRKHRDEAVVHKVNRLKDAIEELSDGEEMDFSVAELSAYLDLSVEEIEDILRLTGEEQ